MFLKTYIFINFLSINFCFISLLVWNYASSPHLFKSLAHLKSTSAWNCSNRCSFPFLNKCLNLPCSFKKSVIGSLFLVYKKVSILRRLLHIKASSKFLLLIYIFSSFSLRCISILLDMVPLLQGMLLLQYK